MNLKDVTSKTRRGLGLLALAGVAGFLNHAAAQLPPDFPQVSLWPNTNPAPGYLFGSLSVSNVPGLWSNWFGILDNTTNAILLNKTSSLGTMACNGLFVNKAAGSPTAFQLKDENFNVLATYQAGNGFTADNHDFQVMPNGHVLVECSDNNAWVDMSKLVPGGFPAALPTEFIIQEQDVDGNVVWQWRSLDHIPPTDSLQTLTGQSLGDYIHINAVWFDTRDNTFVLSCRNTSEAIKINRTTGELVWRMGAAAKHNMFTFINGIPGFTDPLSFQVQHSVRLWPNGHLSAFDNGYSLHSDPQWNLLRPYSRGVDYILDEVNMTATLVWAFRHTPDIITQNGGAVQSLPGGHWVITWGNDNNASPALAMTEVDASGSLVCDVALPQRGVTGNFTRQLWPVESTYANVTIPELYAGNTYVFNQGTNVTGVALQVSTLTADMYNSVTVSRQPFAPVLPRFLDAAAPSVVPVRVVISQDLVSALAGELSFDVASFGLTDATNTTVYYRSTPGQGLFVALPTAYNWVTRQLQADMSDFGEYILGTPDAPQVPYPPQLISPAQNAVVNQSAPVYFSWTPRGFAADYNVQVSTDPAFGTLVTNVVAATKTFFWLPNVAANTTYYWRANTDNAGGTSDWSTNTFTTAPPSIQLAVPAGGEAWQRGVSHVVQWNSDLGGTFQADTRLGGNVGIDLYKSGSLIRTLTTNAANLPAYTWQASVTLTPGSDYAIRIRSTTNAAIFAMSGAFSIVDAPTINPGSIMRLLSGSVQFNVTAPGASTVTVLGSSDLATWQVLQATVPVTNGAVTVTDNTASSYSTRFYRVQVP